MKTISAALILDSSLVQFSSSHRLRYNSPLPLPPCHFPPLLPSAIYAFKTAYLGLYAMESAQFGSIQSQVLVGVPGDTDDQEQALVNSIGSRTVICAISQYKAVLPASFRLTCLGRFDKMRYSRDRNKNR